MDFVNFDDFMNNYNFQNISNKNNINNNIQNPPTKYEDLEFINNQMILNHQNNSNNNFPKLYNIKENNLNIYIENTNQYCTIKIPKSFDKQISIVDNENELMNINPYKIIKADSIIGILSLNNNKYLGIVTNITEIIYFMDSYIYRINSIEFIKITYNNESLTDKNLIQNIKNLFSTGNFYYSNNYDLSLSLNNQVKTNNSWNNNDILNSKYIINSSLLKYFLTSRIPEFFFSKIIFGYIGCQNEINLSEDINMDIIIIEKYINKNLFITNDIPGYIKQIELISNFKNKSNKNTNKVFSFICYINSESLKHINKFLPFKSILTEELRIYKNIICILNNINNNKEDNNMKIDNVIRKNNNVISNKIKQILFTYDFNNKIFFDKVNQYIDFYSNSSNDFIQNNIFWFIEINNIHLNDDTSFNIIIKLFWKIIYKGIMYIGLLNKNNIDSMEKYNNIIYNQLYELKIKYKNDLIYIKKPLFFKNKEKNQEIIDKFFNYSKNCAQNENKLKYNINKSNCNTFNNNKESIYELKKLKLLCITWNIGGLPYDNYDISKLFTHNIFYTEKNSPDIILISIQEIVKLNIKNILSIHSSTKQENIFSWKELFESTIKNTYPQEKYFELKSLNLVGIFILILIKQDIKNNIYLLDHNVTKKGMYGTLGNKGFFTVSMQCYDKIISVGTGHFEAGRSKNNQRINTLTELLNKPINIQEDELITFKEVDYWIILGDLNFRIDLSYDEALYFIQDKNYDILYGKDQFNSAREKNKILKKYVFEKKINFDPTYKYEKNSDEYAYDEEKIRVPAWTDRIFFNNTEGIKMIDYDCIKSLKFSDHRPVVGTFEIDAFSNKKIKENKNRKMSQNINQNKIAEKKIELIDIDQSEKENINQSYNLNNFYSYNGNNKINNNLQNGNKNFISNNNMDNNINKSNFDNQNFYDFLHNNKDKIINNKENSFSNFNIINNNYNNNQNMIFNSQIIFNSNNVFNNPFNNNLNNYINQNNIMNNRLSLPINNNLNNFTFQINNNMNNRLSIQNNNTLNNYNNQIHNNMDIRLSMPINNNLKSLTCYNNKINYNINNMQTNNILNNYNNQTNNNINNRMSLQNNNSFNNFNIQFNLYNFNNNLNNNYSNNFTNKSNYNFNVNN